MKLLTQFYKRDFTAMAALPWAMPEVRRMSWKAVGGPNIAQIKVSGSEQELWETMEMLRCPVRIYTSWIDPVWTGFIESVELKLGKLTVSATLERMANKICVKYGEVNSAGAPGEQKTTAWVENSDSETEYGTYELRSMLSQATAAQALQEANTILERRKYPRVKHNFATGETVEGTITCSGWWKTLGWKYYSNTSGKEGYETIGEGLQAFGSRKVQKVAQSFQLSSAVGWQAASVRVRMRKNGSPTDNITVKLCSDSAGAPGTVLATSTVTGSTLSQYLNWVDFVLSARVTLATSTTYWITVERSGSLHDTNNYAVDTNQELGYTLGLFKMYNGSVWGNRSPNADMVFAVGGVTETSQQVSDMLTTSGQFISAVDVESASGVYSCPWRDGEQTALVSIEELLNGGTTNNRRLLATINADRRVRIYEEPVRNTADYYVDKDGQVWTSNILPVDPFATPVGVWMRLKDAVPPTANVTRLTDPEYMFVEEFEYDVAQGRGVLRERDFEQVTGVKK